MPNRSAALLACALAVGGCATSANTVVSPASAGHNYKSVYLETHGGDSADMDANVQSALFQHGLAIKTGPQGSQAPEGTDLIVRYSDTWRWDMAMYLQRLDVQAVDGKSSELLATGSWKNSAMHGFHGAEKVVQQVIDDLLGKLGVK